MHLIQRTALGLPRRLAQRPGLVAAWAVGVAALEFLGRQIMEELVDVLGLALLLGLLLATFALHLHEPLAWIAGLGRRSRALGARLREAVPELALDLRGTPPLPPGLPTALGVATVVLGAAVVGLCVTPVHLPSAARSLLAPVAYSAWIALLLGAYAVLGLAIAVTLLHTVQSLHGMVRGLLPPRMRRERSGPIASGVWLLIWIGGSLWLPAVVPFAGLLAVTAVALALLFLPGNGRMTVLWRPSGSPLAPRAAPASAAVASYVLPLVLLLSALGLLAAHGGEVPVADDPLGTEAGLTRWIGRLVLVSAFGAVLVSVVTLARFVRVSRSLEPRPEDARTAHLAIDALDAEDVEALRREAETPLRNAGWRARVAPARPEPFDVPLRVARDAAPPDELDPFARWPLRLPPEALTDEKLLERLERRRVLLLRRHLARGFRRLFKRVPKSRARGGKGVWIGLQHWFLLGAMRDGEPTDDEGEGSFFGPPFHRLFARPARRHYAEVLAALEVDLVFVEDGLGFRRFRRALGVLFETYDIHGGRARLEERHFVGLPGTRAVIHELLPDRPFPRVGAGYPEPEYDNIGRARVLHLFKDRGLDEAPAEVPADLTDLPVPVLTG